jgi:glycerophosphoryl diester phosphodiesterase
MKTIGLSIVAAAALAAANVCMAVGADFQKPLSGRTAVTAHTGCMKTPMNTVESIRKGIECGADFVEFDLRFSETGEPILSHDRPRKGANPERLKNAFAELRRHPGIKFNVDLKTATNLPEVKRLAEEAGVLDRIFYTGNCDAATIRRHSPGVPFYLNARIDGKTDLDAVVRRVKEVGAIGLNIHFRCASAELVRKCHEAGFEVSVWTVEKRADVERLLKMGVDNITSRNIALTRQLRDEMRSKRRER